MSDSEKAGNVSFNQLHAKMVNISKIDSLIKGRTTLEVTSRVMNEAKLSASFIFPYSKFNVAYQASGTLAPIQISAFNPMIVLEAAVKIKSGQLHNLEFDFQYYYSESNGELNFEYDNLDFRIINRDDGTERTVNSFFMDALAVHNKNISGKFSYRKGKIQFERAKKKSIFNYWSK